MDRVSQQPPPHVPARSARRFKKQHCSSCVTMPLLVLLVAATLLLKRRFRLGLLPVRSAESHRPRGNEVNFVIVGGVIFGPNQQRVIFPEVIR